MCNYNHGRYLAQAVEAIVNQSRPPDEFIILDDGSSDDSVRIIKSYAIRYPYIHFLQNECNRGVLASVQKAYAAQHCDYVYWGAADDYVLPDFFEKAMAMADRYPQAGVIFGNFIAVNDKGSTLGSIRPSLLEEACFVRPQQFLENYLEIERPDHSLSGATIYRRECLQDVGGFRPELGSWCDTFAINAIALKHGACYVPEVFMCWRVLPGSLSTSTATQPKRLLDIVARASYLMRSAGFQRVFPQDFVESWECRYRKLIIEEHLRSLCQPTGFLVRDNSGQNLFQRKISQAIASCVRRLRAGLHRKTIAKQRLFLERYRGDLSCYQDR